MTYEQTLAYIHSHKRALAAPGLERIKKLLAAFENPQNQIKTVHIAGTNGKGSTSTMIAGILQASGYRTGLFISPYIYDFRERIQIDGAMIPEQDLVDLFTELRPVADAIPDLVEFELITAAAFIYFYRRQCDIAVIEVGLGGKYDSTNVIEKPVVSVITPIGLDHMQFLGDNIPKIAAEKSGIIKPFVPVITSAQQDSEALAVILEHCAEKQCRLVQPGKPRILNMDIKGSELLFEDMKLHIPLAGKFQTDNAMTALVAAQTISEQGFSKINMESCRAGLAGVKFPSRMQMLSEKPLVILDGAHNAHGAKALSEGISLFEGRPITALIGMMADKNIDAFFSVLSPHLSRIFLAAPNQQRAADVQALFEAAKRHHSKVRMFEVLDEAYRQAVAAATAEDGAVLICGSFFLASEIREIAARTI